MVLPTRAVRKQLSTAVGLFYLYFLCMIALCLKNVNNFFLRLWFIRNYFWIIKKTVVYPNPFTQFIFLCQYVHNYFNYQTTSGSLSICSSVKIMPVNIWLYLQFVH